MGVVSNVAGGGSNLLSFDIVLMSGKQANCWDRFRCLLSCSSGRLCSNKVL